MRPSFVLRFVAAVFAVAPRAIDAQQVQAREVSSQQAFEGTLAAINYLFFEADSLPSVEWPSPKALLARRAGTIVFSGISTRMREGPANAIEITERIVAALKDRGLPARAASREATRELCTRTLIEPRRSRTNCTFPDDVGLLILVGYPTLREPLVARITVVADSRLLGENPVISMDVSVENMNGTWRVVSIRRTSGIGE